MLHILPSPHPPSKKYFPIFNSSVSKKSNIEWTMGPGIFRRPIVRSGGRVLARAHDRTYISVSISQRHGNNVNQIENICYINISDRYTHNTYNMRSVCVFVQRMHHRRHSSDYFWVCSTHKQNPTQSKYAWKVLSETKKTFFILLFFMKSSFLSDRIGLNGLFIWAKKFFAPCVCRFEKFMIFSSIYQ